MCRLGLALWQVANGMRMRKLIYQRIISRKATPQAPVQVPLPHSVQLAV